MPKINDAIWQDYDNSGQIKEKLGIVQQWIPDDVRSIIDVGCGNGVICNSLASKYDVTGIDVSETALVSVTTTKILCSATNIPVADNSFDLAFSSEMLEHLSDDDLTLAINEMKRIAKKYILVSVPNEELLKQTMVKCKACNSIYHAYGHLHSFSITKLASYFPGMNIEKVLRFGPINKDYNPLLLWIKNNFAGQYFHPVAPVLCPQCESETYVLRSNPISKICNLINSLIAKPKPYWLMILFSKS